MSYWDTSALVKLYVQESDSPDIENLALLAPTEVITSRIALYEARSTFRRKEAEAGLILGTADKLYSALSDDVLAGDLQLVELGPDVEREYGVVLSRCYQHEPPILIRTLDAVHLASAIVSNMTEVVVTDNRMRAAAALLGFKLFPV